MSSRLKQFLLSLVNATLMLAIILVLLGLLLLNQAESFANDVVSDVKFALLKEIDTDVQLVVESIRATDRDLRAVEAQLKALVEQPEITLSPEIRADISAVNAKLDQLTAGVSKLLNSHDSLSDQSVRRIASTVAETYIAARHCKRPAATAK